MTEELNFTICPKCRDEDTDFESEDVYWGSESVRNCKKCVTRFKVHWDIKAKSIEIINS